MVLIAAALLVIPAGRALASTTQVAMFQDDPQLLADPAGTLARLRLLGVGSVRVAVRWLAIAPNAGSHRRPSGFHAVSPSSYPARSWGSWDAIVKDARAAGIAVNFNVVGGAPLWATGAGAPKNQPHPNWEPSPSEFGAFVHALGSRYSGNYDPKTHSISPGNPDDLPAVRFWSIWNEPDYGPSLAPQGLPGNLSVEHSPLLYRGLLDAAWTALHQTGHARDTVLFGEVAPRGEPNPQAPTATFGIFSGMLPLVFVRNLYCLDSHYRQLRGAAAALRGCPTTAAGSRLFRAAHPALFQSAGFADHPYSRWYQPNVEAQPDPDYSVLAEIGSFGRSFDRVLQAYGSQTKMPIWDTEYGYITAPPKHPTKKTPYVSETTAAYYMNWAEYISWRNPRIKSTMQYLLKDPLPALPSNDWGSFASGLVKFNGVPKASYNAYRLPLYLPVTTSSSSQSLEVWGCVRPAHFAMMDVPADPEAVQIQFQKSSHGPFTTLDTVPITDPHGYFDTHVAFPASGTVRLVWTYPADDPQLVPGYTVYSRHVQVTVH